MVQLVENKILQRVQSSMVHIMFLHQRLRKLHRGVEQKGCYEPEVVGNAKETEFSRYRRADAHLPETASWAILNSVRLTNNGIYHRYSLIL